MDLIATEPWNPWNDAQDLVNHPHMGFQVMVFLIYPDGEGHEDHCYDIMGLYIFIHDYIYIYIFIYLFIYLHTYII